MAALFTNRRESKVGFTCVNVKSNFVKNRLGVSLNKGAVRPDLPIMPAFYAPYTKDTAFRSIDLVSEIRYCIKFNTHIGNFAVPYKEKSGKVYTNWSKPLLLKILVFWNVTLCQMVNT